LTVDIEDGSYGERMMTVIVMMMVVMMKAVVVFRISS